MPESLPSTRRLSRALPFLLVAALFIVEGAARVQVPSLAEAAPLASTPDCTLAAIHDIELSRATAVDEVRVVVDSVGGGVVSVSDEDGDRQVQLGQTPSKSVFFYPGMWSKTYRVSLLPDLETPSACVERIELRHAGKLVSVFRP